MTGHTPHPPWAGQARSVRQRRFSERAAGRLIREVPISLAQAAWTEHSVDVRHRVLASAVDALPFRLWRPANLFVGARRGCGRRTDRREVPLMSN